MSTDLETLARRAVACKHWRWMEGMACQWNHPRSGAGGQQVMPTWARVVDHPMGPFPLTYCIVDVYSVYRFAYPDLTDPATLGCLLALVREAHNAPHAFVEHCEVMRRNAFFCRVTRRSSAYETEAEALVAALEAAP